MSEDYNEDSFFGDTDVDDVPDNPNDLPNNTYKFRVISAKYGKTNAGDKVGITFKYQIVEGAWSTFFPLNEWVRVPEKTLPKDERKRLLGYLKMHFLGFGFTPEEIQGLKPSMVTECVGREFYGTTSTKRDKDGRTNIRVVKFDPIDEMAGDSDEDTDY